MAVVSGSLRPRVFVPRSGSRSLDGSVGMGGSAWECGLQGDGPPDWGCTYPETDAEDGAGEERVVRSRRIQTRVGGGVTGSDSRSGG